MLTILYVNTKKIKLGTSSFISTSEGLTRKLPIYLWGYVQSTVERHVFSALNTKATKAPLPSLGQMVSLADFKLSGFINILGK